MWLFIIFFGIGIGYVSSSIPFRPASIGLGLITAANMAEIYRGGLLAMHKGQFEAAAALGEPVGRRWRGSSGRRCSASRCPSATTYAIGLLKDSAIASTIGVKEIVFGATGVSQATGEGLTPFLIAAVVYIALGAPLAWLSRTMDAKMRARVAK